MEALLECIVCMTTSGEPKTLPCHHWLCVQCIEGLIRSSTNGYLNCPQCRDLVQIPQAGAKGFETDFRQIQLRDYMKNQARDVKCSMDPGHDAKKLCKECSVHFCLACAHEHSTRKFFSNHQLLPIVLKKCTTHDRLLEYVCENCPKLLCSLCLQISCGDHDEAIQKIVDVADARKAEMNIVIKQIQQLLQNNNEFQQTRSQVIRKLRKTSKDFRKGVLETSQVMLADIRDKTDYLLKHIASLEHCLDEKEVWLREVDRASELKGLLQAVDEADKSGLSQILMTIGAIKSTIPAFNDEPMETADETTTMAAVQERFVSFQELIRPTIFEEIGPYRTLSFRTGDDISGNNLSAKYHITTPILQIKENIQEFAGKEYQLQRLFCKGIELEDSETIAYYRIEQNEVINVVFLMQIFVRTSNGTFVLNVCKKPSEKIERVQSMIESKTGIPADLQSLSSGTKFLQPGHTLEDYNIQKESTLFVRVRVRSSKQPDQDSTTSGDY